MARTVRTYPAREITTAEKLSRLHNERVRIAEAEEQVEFFVEQGRTREAEAWRTHAASARAALVALEAQWGAYDVVSAQLRAERAAAV